MSRPAKAPTSRKLVINTDVVRSAGGEGAVDPHSKACRDLLSAVLDLCHRVVLTDAIEEEWLRHRSKYARTWQEEMFGRKKVVRLDVPHPSGGRAILDAVEKAGATEAQLDAAEKDAHLIAAALATDRAVVSCDAKVAAIFALGVERSADLGSLDWASPADARTLPWLRDSPKTACSIRAAAASHPASLLVRYIRQVCALLAPSRLGASAVLG